MRLLPIRRRGANEERSELASTDTAQGDSPLQLALWSARIRTAKYPPLLLDTGQESAYEGTEKEAKVFESRYAGDRELAIWKDCKQGKAFHEQSSPFLILAFL